MAGDWPEDVSPGAGEPTVSRDGSVPCLITVDPVFS